MKKRSWSDISDDLLIFLMCLYAILRTFKKPDSEFTQLTVVIVILGSILYSRIKKLEKKKEE